MILNELLRVPRCKTLPGVFPLGNYEFRRDHPLSIGHPFTHLLSKRQKSLPVTGKAPISPYDSLDQL